MADSEREETFSDEITRRELVRRAAGAAVAGGAVAALWPVAAAARSAELGGVAGGELRVGIIGFPVSWDSAFATNTATYLIRNVLDPLVQLREDLSAAPALARSWRSSGGGKVWDFTLVQNARWHDGTPFTSKDVVAHFRRILNPKTGSAGQQVYEAVRSVQPRGDHAVRFNLKFADADFPLLLGLYQGNIQAAHLDPKTLGKRSMIGTGPFKWGRVVPGQSLSLVRNDAYFVRGQPALDSLVFVTFEDEQARLNALLSGAIDVAPDLPKNLAKQLQSRGDMRVIRSIPGGMTVVYLRADQKPGDDPRVIRALRMTVDRRALVQVALSGFGTPTGDTPIAPGSPAYVNVRIPPRDVNRARQLLAAAGYPNGVDLELFVPGGRPSNQELALGLQSMARDAGFRIKITTIPADTFFSKYWLKQTFGVDDWGARPTVDSQFRIAYTCKGVWNESHWCDKKFDSMLDRARAETNAARRKQLLSQLQRYFAENSNVLIPYHFPILTAHRTAVSNVRETPIVLYTDFRRARKRS
jgi:peptide/nickel transport system substrate-binding protein